VTNLIAKMEAAAEVDADEHNEGRPAFNKLRMVSEVDGFLAQVGGSCAAAAETAHNNDAMPLFADAWL
jgi:hypothetical protein